MTRDERIIQMARQLITLKKTSDRFIEIDDYISETSISEGEKDNGAWVKAWIWVDFKGTDLDKEP